MADYVRVKLVKHANSHIKKPLFWRGLNALSNYNYTSRNPSFIRIRFAGFRVFILKILAMCVTFIRNLMISQQFYSILVC